MQLTSTVTLVELIWTLGCLPGLYYNSRITYRAAGDLATLRIRRINSIREFSAMTTLTLFGYLSVMQFAFVLIGVLAMLVPSPRGGVTPTSYAITGIFLILSVTSSFVGFIVDRRRKYLLLVIAAMEDEEDAAKLKEVIHGKS